MIDIAQEIIQPLPRQRVFWVAAIVDPSMEDFLAANLVVKHCLFLVGVKIVSLSSADPNVFPLAADLCDDVQVHQLF